ncbi:hypothetical protein [Paenibacillus sp. CMAA1364]
MAEITIINDTTIKIGVRLEDAISMVTEAARDISLYARDIVTIYEKMPVFEYTYFCFYAYDSAALFEFMLGIDPKQYNNFSLDAPDSFFYALYGGMAALYDKAKEIYPSDI